MVLDTSKNKCIAPIKDGATFSHWKKSSLWTLIVLKAERKIFVFKKKDTCGQGLRERVPELTCNQAIFWPPSGQNGPNLHVLIMLFPRWALYKREKIDKKPSPLFFFFLDPWKTSQGMLSLKVFRLSDKMMAMYKEAEFNAEKWDNFFFVQWNCVRGRL